VLPALHPAGAVADGVKWSDLSLGYNLSRSTADLSDGDVSAALYRAYRSWCLVARIVVQQVSANTDIDVRFETGDHGDGWPFDGVGDTRNVLAHGFYPPSTSSTAIAGDLHFDDDETWTRDLPPTGTDLDTVALHEAGHTLGLDHSATTSAVMYAFYGGARRTLTSDDIEGIRSLYGTRERNVFRDLDAAVEGQGRFHGKGYFFYGFRYLRYDFSDDLPDPSYPRHIRTEWHGLPDGWDFPRGIDAAMNGQLAFDGKLYMFRGDQYSATTGRASGPTWAPCRSEPNGAECPPVSQPGWMRPSPAEGHTPARPISSRATSTSDTTDRRSRSIRNIPSRSPACGRVSPPNSRRASRRR
jgi:hypothetical protein